MPAKKSTSAAEFPTAPDKNFHLLQLIQLKPSRLGSRVINVRGNALIKTFQFTGLYIADYVTAHLAKTFYNLTAVALHDCETYKKMRLLAKHRYGLVISDSHLPSMKVDQGLDLLAVIRKLNVFVSHYSYDLNEQVPTHVETWYRPKLGALIQMFVERNSKSRMLNVMRVQQVVNSIKTHGVGLLNSTVNAAYQLLKKKFQAFSQFLYDEQIRV